MSYNWLTQYNSPNYTPANRVQATWGRPRTIEAIAIHWWGDPNQNPSFESVVNYLCRANGSSSAHLVATGTGRKVACIVNFADASWATNSANPYTISIECDPRCRDEDYDVVAELIAQLRQVYGNIPLVPHKQFVATACPGNYNLDRLNKIANTKIARPDAGWGDVTTKEANMPTLIDEEGVRILAAGILDRAEPLTTTPDLRGHIGGDALAKLKEFWYSKEGKAAHEAHKNLLTDKAKLETRNVELEKEVGRLKDELANKPTEKPSDGSFTENDRNTLSGIQKAVESLWNGFKAIFNIKE